MSGNPKQEAADWIKAAVVREAEVEAFGEARKFARPVTPRNHAAHGGARDIAAAGQRR